MALHSLFCLILLLSSSSHIARATKLTYIVHVKKPAITVSSESQDKKAWYQSFLPVGTASTDDEEDRRMLYAYSHVISGFAAKLTQEEVAAMAKKDGFIKAYPERLYRPQTTQTPGFLGLQQGLGFWNQSNFGQGVIIGLLDTGITPNHPSFVDEGMPPPPARWKGKCEFNSTSGCNNKLIGARSFTNGSSLPVDEVGHGTHTSGIAAGNFVKDADFLGNAKGTAVGIAPRAYIAMYKVCTRETCTGSDILAGIDAAIHDGVDVISISLAGQSGIPMFESPIASGTYAAMQKGIFVSCGAGNNGPKNSSIPNEAPWYLTVAASTLDRRFVVAVKLGNGEETEGEGLFQPKSFNQTLVPIVVPNSAFCGEGTLNGTDVRGKVVLCQIGGGVARIAKGKEVKASGGAAMILINGVKDSFSTPADTHVLPTAYVSFEAGQKIKAYVNLTNTPTATLLFKGTVMGDSSAPAVAAFSSRGPTIEAKGILKPDIIGPGVSILAAWPLRIGNDTNPEKSRFNVISGTSMACPHLSGIAALLKSSHPDWSPAVIKSAMMTTADTLNLDAKPIIDQNLQPADLFATGSGHVNPARANDPGLVYDIQPDDYIPYLCGLGYTDDQVEIIAQQNVNCSKQEVKTADQLNYPSFTVTMGPRQTFSRTVTNIGEANSAYNVTVLKPAGVDVIVEPSSLKFSDAGEKATYTVTFSRVANSNVTGGFADGYIKWVSDKHSVRSPVSVMFT